MPGPLMRWLMGGSARTGVLTLDRLNALSDGVIAVVATLLVLGIEVPQGHEFRKDGFFAFLQKIEYEVVVYAQSFALVGIYWVQHNAMFHYLRHGSRRLIWLNLNFLFLLTLIPFVTELIGTYRNEPLVIMIFAVANILCGLSLAWMWQHAIHANLIWPSVDPAVIHSMTQRILLGPLLCLLAVAVSFFNVRLSQVVFLSIPLAYFSHRKVDSHWSEVAENHGRDSR